jgi:hypothetical protein
VFYYALRRVLYSWFLLFDYSDSVRSAVTKNVVVARMRGGSLNVIIVCGWRGTVVVSWDNDLLVFLLLIDEWCYSVEGLLS